MRPATLAVLAVWLIGASAVCRGEPLGRPMLGAACALAMAAVIGSLS